MQLVLFAVIFVLLLGLVVYRLFAEGVNPLWAVVGLGIGVALGKVLARSKVLRWNAEDGMVVGQMDVLGGIILVGYLVVTLLRRRVLGDVVNDASAAEIVGLAMTAGAMAGRVVFTVRGIRQVVAALTPVGDTASS